MDLEVLQKQHTEEFLAEISKVIDRYEDKISVDKAIFSLQLMICNVANEIAPSSEEAADFVYDMVDIIFDGINESSEETAIESE